MRAEVAHKPLEIALVETAFDRRLFVQVGQRLNRRIVEDPPHEIKLDLQPCLYDLIDRAVGGEQGNPRFRVGR